MALGSGVMFKVQVLICKAVLVQMLQVTVGCQTEPGEKVRESLQDTVTAFLMQNKFLNKEVLIS